MSEKKNQFSSLSGVENSYNCSGSKAEQVLVGEYVLLQPFCGLITTACIQGQGMVDLVPHHVSRQSCPETLFT